MAYQLFTLPKVIPLSAGAILPGAKATFYLTGTTTKTDTYTSSALSVANSNPVVADAEGVFAPIYLDPTVTYKLTLTTSADVLVYTVDPVNDQLLSQAIIGAYLFPRTAAETTAGVTPSDYSIPSHEATGKFDLRRYGAAETYDANTDDLQFWNKAISVIAATTSQSGAITGPVRMYQIDGTLDIAYLITPDFGTSNNGGATLGFILFSDTNAPILRFNDTANRFVVWENFSVLGTAAAGTSQHGIVINNGGVRMKNFTIRACGGNGIDGTHSYSSSYRDGYISLCTGDGVRIHGTWGANVWDCIGETDCGGDGFAIDSADGADLMINCISEKNDGVGLHFGASVKGWRTLHHYSELNVGGSLVFDATSDNNYVNFKSWGDSAGTDLNPVNSGGSMNVWDGSFFASGGGGYQPLIGPKLIQRVYTEYSAEADGTPNAIAYDDSIPQSSEGLSVMSRAITPKRTGNRLKVRVSVNFAYSAGSIGTVSLFVGASADAVAAKSVSSGVDLPIHLELEYDMAATDTSSVTFNVNVGSNSAATVTFNGSGAARKLGGISSSTISVEEFWPSA